MTATHAEAATSRLPPSVLAGLARRLGGAAADLLRGDVLGVRRDPPADAEPVAPEHVGHRHRGLRTGSDRAVEHGGDVRHVEVDVRGHDRLLDRFAEQNSNAYSMASAPPWSVYPGDERERENPTDRIQDVDRRRHFVRRRRAADRHGPTL